jgi:hypothetical protein
MATKYTNWPYNITNGSEIDQTAIKFSLQDTPKITQIGSLGSKIYHLATLLWPAVLLKKDKKDF